MSFMYGGTSTPVVEATPAVATESSEDVQAAKKAEADRIRKLKGRKSTILTSGQGVSGVAETEKKSLLGE